jgi:hypothetical protein
MNDPETGEPLIVPRLPRVAGTDRPPGWNQWTEGRKVQHLLGLSLERCCDYLGWQPDELDAYRLAAQAQVVQIIMMIAKRAGVRPPEDIEATKFRRLMLFGSCCVGSAGQFRVPGR